MIRLRPLFTLVVILLFSQAYAQELKIAFGSCNEQDKYNLPIWQAIQSKQPDVFIFLGDNAYIDSEDPNKFKTDYEALFSNPGIVALKQSTDIMATWDDHDYGENDGGKNFVAKHIAKKAFIEAFDYPELNELPKEQGIYHSRLLNLDDKKIRIVMLDTRWYRDDLLTNNLNDETRDALQLGPYRPYYRTDKTLLGAEQWQWLEQLMAEPIDLTIIATSIQFVSEYTAWEIWANFPHERNRMIELIRETNPGKVIFISGDVHRGETSMLPIDDMKIFAITAGPLSSTAYPGKPNIHRYGGVFAELNFGMLTIQHSDGQLSVKSGLYNNDGEPLEEFRVPLKRVPLKTEE